MSRKTTGGFFILYTYDKVYKLNRQLCWHIIASKVQKFFEFDKCYNRAKNICKVCSNIKPNCQFCENIFLVKNGYQNREGRKILLTIEF